MRELENLDELYRDIVLDHYRSPRNSEPLESPDSEGEAVNPFCGDEVRIQLAVSDGLIDAVSIAGMGCSISQASASLMGSAIEAKTLPEALALLGAFRAQMEGRQVEEGVDLGDLAALEGVKRYPVRIKCSLLGWTALEDAIKAIDAD